MPAPATLTLVRHGQTSANVEGVWHGAIDTRLTPHGERQAERVALHLARTRPGIDALYASPLERARLTAAAIGRRLARDVQLDDDLREYDLGAWEGKTYRELVGEHRLFHRMAQEPDWRPGGGESPRAVAERLGGALRRLAERHAGERVAVVTHGGALTLALGWLLENDVSTWRRVVENASVSDLAFSPRAELRSFNHTHHLRGLDDRDD